MSEVPVDLLIHVRGCGKRKPGGVYLVSELSPLGALSAFISIDPVIEWVGPVTRAICATVGLEDFLSGVPYPDCAIEASEARETRKRLRKPEIEKYGMTLDLRLQTGICKAGGLEALSQVRFQNLGMLFDNMRGIDRTATGNAQAEIARTWTDLRVNKDPQSTLAGLWRTWRAATPHAKEVMRVFMSGAMVALDAREDAGEIL